MTKITAADINKLRKQTGVGMMDCKNALTEAEGDFSKAIEILRKKGQKVANKRADRDATEGVIIGKINDAKTKAFLIRLNCETDFVAKNEDFIASANQFVDAAISNDISTLEDLLKVQVDGRSVQDHITDLVGKIGEKIELADFAVLEGAVTYAYNHTGNKLATIVSLNKSDVDEINIIAKEIAMQIAAMNPVAIDKDDVPKEVVDREIEIGKELAQKEGKPENMLEKIALGKLNKFYKENTLLNQDFVRNNKMTVKEYLKSIDKDLKIIDFKRFSLS